MEPSKKSKKIVITTGAATAVAKALGVTPKGIIKFAVKNSNKGLWNTLRKNEYDDCLQPLLELIDNAFASGCTKILITLDFERNVGSIEDDGRGFGKDPEELSRCFTYGPENPRQTDLNEHGCGMKSSLAILDPNDEAWSVTWRCEGLIYQVCAPYANDGMFEATMITSWPGKLEGSAGTVIQFPFKKENLGSLYEKAKGANFARAIEKLRQELSHLWMFFDRFLKGDTKLYLNDKEVQPFVMPAANTECVTKCTVNNGTLTNGANVHIQQYTIASSIPGSHWFKKGMSSNGAYIFKNGRLILKITTGAAYKEIFGGVPDNHHNGMIVLVNVTGPAASLPVTVPTKNRFKASTNPNYDLMFKYMCEKVQRPAQENQSEEALLTKFQKNRCAMFQSAGIKHDFTTEVALRFKDVNFSCPNLDAIETFLNKVFFYEAKKDNRVSIQNIIQLHGNFVLATAAMREDDAEVPTPVLLINADSTYKLPPTLEHAIRVFAKNSSIAFPVEVWNYEAVKLFPKEA